MTGLDLGIILVLLVSVLIGIVRGFIREALSIVSWVGAIWLGFTFSGTTGNMFESWLENEALQTGAGFTVVFVVCLLLFTAISYFIYRAIAVKAIKGTDRILGAFFGLARAALLIGAFVLVASGLDVDVEPWWRDSALISIFEPVAVLLESLLPTSLGGG